MIPELGHFALILALLVALVQGVVPMLGAARRDAALMAVAVPAARAQFVLVAIAFGCLAYSFVTNDFSVENVALNSNSQLPAHYRFAATWGSHEGSLLLWSLMLAGWGAAVTLFSRHLPTTLRARVHRRDGTRRRRLPAVPARDVQSVRAAFAAGAGRPRSQSAAAGPRNGRASADALHGLRRLLGRVRVRDRRADRRPARRRVGALVAAVDDGRVGVPHARHHAGQLRGRTTSSAGAAGGSGIRSRTHRSCRGSSAPR